ncbi:MAG: class I SAM-dependent methyltransferase [Candidatus Omnitrophica bacterium]|nr:class I SAM-dependent methyltransferase [Candidatus Omnitrophota bacterium]
MQKGLFKAEEILIEKYLQPGKNILVIGCATGREAIALARKGFNVTGIDISSEMIEKAKESAQKQNLNIDFEIGNVKNLKFGNEDFDCAIMFGNYAHIYPRENRIKALKEIKRILKEKGILIIRAIRNISYIVMLLFKILHLFPKLLCLIFYKFPLASYPRFYKPKFQYRPYPYHNCVYTPQLPEKITRRYLIKEELTEFSFYIKRLIFSFVSFFVNWKRRLKRLILREKYKGLEPGSFWMGSGEGKVIFRFLSVREVLKDINYAGLNILEYRSVEEIERETSRLSRRWTSKIFYVVKK